VTKFQRAEELLQAATRLIGPGGPGMERAHRAFGRARRPAIVLCVIGLYKQGKSLLVNGLVGHNVSPVDDDLSTSTLILVHGADEIRATVRIAENDEETVRPIELSKVPVYASEAGDPALRAGVRHVEIGLPSAFLADGLVMIDTPGVGGLDPARAQAVLGFLPHADALLFVTDASSELTRSELDFLAKANRACDNSVVILTKTDLYGEWRRIRELDAAHLDRAGLQMPIVPVASTLRCRARESESQELDIESGAPALIELIESTVRPQAKVAAVAQAVLEVNRAIASAIETGQDELSAFTDPEAGRRRRDELDEARTRLASLKATGSTWATKLQDGIGQIRADTDFRLRSFIRDELRRVDADLREDSVPSDHETWGRDLHEKVTAGIQAIYDDLQAGIGDLTHRIADTLEAETIAIEGADWTVSEVIAWEEGTGTAEQASVLGAGLSALRGMQSGVLLLGMLGQLAGLAVMTPVVIGAGLALGTKSVRDERKRRTTRQQQELKAATRQFLEQAQFIASNHFQRVMAEHHRQLRDSFRQRLSELEAEARHRAARADQALAMHESLDPADVELARNRLAELQDLGDRARLLLDGETDPQ
jgi:hypothetical protein